MFILKRCIQTNTRSFIYQTIFKNKFFTFNKPNLMNFSRTKTLKFNRQNHTDAGKQPFLTKEDCYIGAIACYILGTALTFGIFIIKSFYNTFQLEYWNTKNCFIGKCLDGFTYGFLNIIGIGSFCSAGFFIFWPYVIYKHRNGEINETIFGKINMNHIELQFMFYEFSVTRYLCGLDEAYKESVRENASYHAEILSKLENVDKNTKDSIDQIFKKINDNNKQNIINVGSFIPNLLLYKRIMTSN
jgi:hypothetical protein